LFILILPMSNSNAEASIDVHSGSEVIFAKRARQTTPAQILESHEAAITPMRIFDAPLSKPLGMDYGVGTLARFVFDAGQPFQVGFASPRKDHSVRASRVELSRSDRAPQGMDDSGCFFALSLPPGDMARLPEFVSKRGKKCVKVLLKPKPAALFQSDG
jgi:hypothetical protein